MTPWHECVPFIPFDTYYNTHPVVLTQRRTWQVAARLNLCCLRAVNKQEPLTRWQRRTLANTLRTYRSGRHVSL
jgi:hypothetical protein